MSVQCTHEAYLGRCVHCGAQIINGRAMLSTSPDPATDEALVERVARALWDERCKHWGKYRKLLHEPDSEGYDWDDISLSKRKELMREARAAIRAMEEKP